MATKKADTVEVIFTDNVTLDGMPYTKNKRYDVNAEEAENLILSGYAVEFTEDLRVAEDKRKALPQNKPLAESDVVIATHDSGEQVAYKDNREKGPLDVHPTPGTAWTLADTLKAGGSVDAHRIAAERNKGLEKSGARRVEELPAGDLPTGVPVGAHEVAQAATKKLKATAPATGDLVASENLVTVEEPKPTKKK